MIALILVRIDYIVRTGAYRQKSDGGSKAKNTIFFHVNECLNIYLCFFYSFFRYRKSYNVKRYLYTIPGSVCMASSTTGSISFACADPAAAAFLRYSSAFG